MRVERAFLIEGGLPGRPFFRHAIYAPGLTTGYASWPLPGVRQAIEETHQELLNEQVPILIDRIKAATTVMSEAEWAARDEG
jgi:N-acetylated-alpha-linked acidic dipeptidase